MSGTEKVLNLTWVQIQASYYLYVLGLHFLEPQIPQLSGGVNIIHTPQGLIRNF